eukprot:CAMPEP_0204546680 /NCGR_PEP_ID=MMETSP0661-20131031/22222_1 /ASSEMBLY_ACC=CAM_ASM_000606 /TAXON_ID=109239 /ORGANISM="Alexandrium margalefi, Strain AMGDE01CS-322" /LENGTH=141 /DNA_ID=CAMNT_0051553525 /DNA_START=168 /DNA_END=593 /DNA_ORIENTATION=+
MLSPEEVLVDVEVGVPPDGPRVPCVVHVLVGSPLPLSQACDDAGKVPQGVDAPDGHPRPAKLEIRALLLGKIHVEVCLVDLDQVVGEGENVGVVPPNSPHLHGLELRTHRRPEGRCKVRAHRGGVVDVEVGVGAHLWPVPI